MKYSGFDAKNMGEGLEVEIHELNVCLYDYKFS